jgi:hypothetical protein
MLRPVRPFRRSSPSRPLAAALLLGAGLALVVHAPQPARAQPLAAKPTQQTTTLTSEQLDALLAARIYRTAVLDLRASLNPGPTDFAIAQAALAHAKVFAPQSPELARAMVSAAFAASDEQGVQDATRELVRLDPTDTVAQLRLLSSRIRSIQTVEQRTAAYDRLLGSEGDRLDPSVRSRLALDAALVAREVGNERTFADRLRLAVQLDPSNKDAALLALSFAGPQAQDSRARFELLSNLLLSDPLDPAVHLQVRDELAAGGAYAQAERFHSSAMRISGQGEGLIEKLEGLSLRWRTASPAVTVSELNKLLAIARDQQRRALEARGGDVPADLRRPEEIRLPIELEELRALAALAAADSATAQAAITDLVASHAETAALMRDPVRRGDISEASAQEAASQADIKSVAWRLLAGIDAPAASEALPAIIDALPTKDADPRVAVLRTLTQFAAAQDQAVLDGTQDATPDEPYRAIPRALVLARQPGKLREGAVLLREVERRMPLTALGTWAGSRATTLDLTSAHAESATLTSLARGIPTWVDAMATRPGVFQTLTLDHDTNRAKATDVVGLRVRVKNVATVPLAVGEQQAIASRVVLTPRLEVSPPQLASLLQGEVVELDRALRLTPGQELAFTVLRPEAGVLSWVIGSGSANPTRLRYRALQGFGYDVNGILAPGPGGIDTSTGTLERESLPLSRLSIEQLTEKVATAFTAELPELFIACRAAMISDEVARRTANAGSLSQAASTPAGPNVQALAQALADAYTTWSAQHRALALSELPFLGDVPSMSVFDAVAQQETEPSVLPLVVLTRVIDAASPALAAAESSVSPPARRIAALQRTRLASGGGTLASRGLLVTAGLGTLAASESQAAPAPTDAAPASSSSGAEQPAAPSLIEPAPANRKPVDRTP